MSVFDRLKDSILAGCFVGVMVSSSNAFAQLDPGGDPGSFPDPGSDPSDPGTGDPGDPADPGDPGGGDDGQGNPGNGNCYQTCGGSAGVGIGGKVNISIDGEVSFGAEGKVQLSGGANVSFGAMWTWSCTNSDYNRGLHRFSTADCRYEVNNERRFVPDAKNTAIAAVSSAMVELTGKVTAGLGVGGNGGSAGPSATVTGGLTNITASEEVACTGKTGPECAILVKEKVIGHLAPRALPSSFKSAIDLYMAFTGRGDLNKKLNQLSDNTIGNFNTFVHHFNQCLWSAGDENGSCE